MTRRETRLRVERMPLEDGFRAAPPAWLELQRRCSSTPIFLTWEWVSTWWRHFEPEREAWLVAASDAEGRVRGIVPLVLGHESHGPIRLRRLAFAGTGIAHPAHLDVLARPEDKAEVVRALLDHLREHRKDWDVLDIASVGETSELNQTLADEGRSYTAGAPTECRFLSLPDCWEEYAAKSLTGKLRSNLRAQLRRLERDHPGAVEFHAVSESSELDDAIRTLDLLHRKRWKGKAGATPLEHPGFAGFFSDFATLALKLGWLRFHQLRLAGEVVAVNYCFRYRDVVYGYQKAFDPDFARYGPGQLLQAHAIRAAIGEHTREFDMLQGEQPDKRAWAANARNELRALYSLRPKGELYMKAVTAYERTKPLAQRVVPRRIQTHFERIAFERGL